MNTHFTMRVANGLIKWADLHRALGAVDPESTAELLLFNRCFNLSASYSYGVDVQDVSFRVREKFEGATDLFNTTLAALRADQRSATPTEAEIETLRSTIQILRRLEDTKTGRGNSTANDARYTLESLLTFCEDYGWVDEDFSEEFVDDLTGGAD